MFVKEIAALKEEVAAMKQNKGKGKGAQVPGWIPACPLRNKCPDPGQCGKYHPSWVMAKAEKEKAEKEKAEKAPPPVDGQRGP